jgi:protein-L-isoaspartate(D-aspartate) O-methyltransferase
MTDFAAVRAILIEKLRNEVRDERVLEAMARVPREEFVREVDRSVAYVDRALPIGLGQTISQPLIVAMMTEALELAGGEKVLEVGTGSGYQTAILAELAHWVVTVERLPEFAESAHRALSKLGYVNVEVHVAGRDLGWPEEAPYDGIMVTAAAPQVPDHLLDQLVLGGRLVIPVGSRFEQDLLQLTKRSSGIVSRNLGGCRFVPLVGEGAWADDGE